MHGSNVHICGKMYLNVALCSANVPLNDAKRESPGNSGLVPQLWSRRTLLICRSAVLCCVLTGLATLSTLARAMQLPTWKRKSVSYHMSHM